MAGKQAKILSDHQIRALLGYLDSSRYPKRDKVMLLLSVKAGLRAIEISRLTWSTLLDPQGELTDRIELPDHIAKRQRAHHPAQPPAPQRSA